MTPVIKLLQEALKCGCINDCKDHIFAAYELCIKEGIKADNSVYVPGGGIAHKVNRHMYNCIKTYAPGEKIGAIKYLRDHYGSYIDQIGQKRMVLGLKEAKDMVEHIWEN